MSMDDFAKDYLKRAGERLLAGEAAMARGSYPEVVRYSQEATELSLKAALRSVGIEYPKVHDVGEILVLYKDRFEDWFAKEVERMAVFSAEMMRKRSAALYGLEATGKPPGEVFDDPAESGADLEEAKRIHQLCGRLIGPKVN
ncbi:MAG: HEPN domain-containing protein [Nitrososphaerota archaeon]|nr:HEPN domain-containing protein [Nitrososphaerota archaeon]